MSGTVSITLGGSKKLTLSDQIVSLFVDNQFNQIPKAELTFTTGNFNERKYPLFSEMELQVGKSISISIRYEQPNSTDRNVFTGVIVERSALTHNNLPALRLSLRDPAWQLTNSNNFEIFQNKTDSDVISKVLQRHKGLKLTNASELKRFQVSQLIQQNQSDWHFVLDRIRANGYLVRMNDGELTLQNDSSTSSNSVSLDVGVEGNVLDFELIEDSQSLLSTATVQFWDLDTNKTVSVDKRFNNPLTKQVSSPTASFNPINVHTKTEADAWLNGVDLDQKLFSLHGFIKVKGSSEFATGQKLKLVNFPLGNNVSHLVTRIEHSLKAGEWTTKIHVGQTKPRPSSHPTATHHQALGVQRAIVKKWKSDDKSQRRILVEIPAWGEGFEYWAYLTHTSAGSQHGAYDPPKKDDEVLIEFLNDDPGLGFVIGSVYPTNKPLPQPFKYAEETPIGYVNKELSIIFDASKKDLSVDNNSKNIIEMNDKKGITVKSGDFSLDSKGKAQFKSSTTMNLKAKTINLN